MASLSSDGDDGVGSEWESPPVDRILQILQAAPRRDVLAFLADNPNRAVSTDDLIDYIVDKRGLSGDLEDRRRVEVQLHHHHLPKLAEEGIIEFDPNSDVLRYSQNEAVERWLDRIREGTSDTETDN